MTVCNSYGVYTLLANHLTEFSGQFLVVNLISHTIYFINYHYKRDTCKNEIGQLININIYKFSCLLVFKLLALIDLCNNKCKLFKRLELFVNIHTENKSAKDIIIIMFTLKEQLILTKSLTLNLLFIHN